MTTNIYLHETLDPVRAAGAHQRYLDQLGEVVQREGNAEGSAGGRCIAAWATVFLTGQWPQIVTFWQMPGSWDGFAAHFDTHPELFHKPLERWYGERTGGFDRVLVGTDYTPTLDELVERGVRAPVILQQTITVRPGAATDYLGHLGELKSALADRDDIDVFGAYTVAFRNDSEVIVHWAYPSFDALVRSQTDADLDGWVKLSAGFETSHTGVVLRPTSWSALK